MDTEETVDLLEELESLRGRVAELSEAVADARARRIHQEAVISRLRQELQRTQAVSGRTSSPASGDVGPC